MPIYEYQCTDCDSPFEELVRMGDDHVSCPSCGSADVTRLLSQFTAARPGAGEPLAVPAATRSGGCCGGACGCGH